MQRETTYSQAVHYCKNSLILCNSIPELDDSIFDNLRFSLDESEYIYQWYITDCTFADVEFLEKSFHLLFTYSDKLDCFILCVDHFGTCWDGVPCTCYNDDIPETFLKKAS